MNIMQSCILFIIAAISLDYAFAAWQCKDKSTPYNSNGGSRGDMSFLDRHYLDCGHQGMVKFHLDLNGNTMRYEYFCCNLPAGKHGPYRQAPNCFNFTSDGNGDANFLDRQAVDCGANVIMTAHHLEKNNNDGHNAIHYSFSYLQFSLRCQNATTQQRLTPSTVTGRFTTWTN